MNIPKGLEILDTLDHLYIKQKVELLEAITGFETANQYEIKNDKDETLFWAHEDTCCCTRNCGCGSSRQFNMKILDKEKVEVIHLYRPLRCKSCWFPCCMQSIVAEAPPGIHIGSVNQSWHICLTKYNIKDGSGVTQFRLVGPCCMCKLCGDIEFQIKSADEKAVLGHISKHWAGFVKELFTDAENFSLNFPPKCDVRMKVAMLSAVFLIDYMFFENNDRKK